MKHSELQWNQLVSNQTLCSGPGFLTVLKDNSELHKSQP